MNLIKETAGKKVLLSAVHAAVKENLDNDKLQEVLKFYDSKTGKKVGRLYETRARSRANKGFERKADHTCVP